MGIFKLPWAERIRIQRLVLITNFTLLIERWIEGL